MENKNFASRSEIKNNAVKIKSEWDVAKNIIEKIIEGYVIYLFKFWSSSYDVVE